MYTPKRRKYRKAFKGVIRRYQFRKTKTKPSFGCWYLKAKGYSRITGQQLEACRRVLSRCIGREGSIWIRVFPQVPVSQKPNEVRIGKGKGLVKSWVVPVRPGQILFEVDGISARIAIKSLKKSSFKLPVNTVYGQRLIF